MNYRVCKSRMKEFDPDLHDPEDEFYYGIHEVYYNDKKEIEFTSVDPISPYGLTLEEIKENVNHMKEALDEPIIDLDTIVYVSTD